MRFKWTIFLVLLFNSVNLFAQTRLNGDYNADYNTFDCSDPNVIVKNFLNGRAAFMIKGANPGEWKTNHVGFIDTTGKIVIKPVYANCSDFINDLALVMDTSGKRGAINRNGEIIIPFAAQEIEWCTNGLYLISRYADISLVDGNGRTIVPFGKYTACERYWAPLYGYSLLEEGGDDGGSGRRGFAWYTLPLYRLALDQFITVQSGTGRTAKWAVITRDGKEIIPPKFDAIGPFTKGLAPFLLNKKCGVMDTTGALLIGPEYDNLAVTSDGLVIAIKDKKSGVISLKNKIIVPFKYDRIDTAGAGAFLVDTGKGMPYKEYADHGKPYLGGITAKFGVINKSGRIIIPVENQSIQPFGTGYLVFKRSDSAAFFDSAGVRKTAYAAHCYVSYPVCWLGDNQGFLVYKKRTRDFIHYEIVDRLCYKAGGKWGRLDSAGEEVTKAIYDKFWFLNRYNVTATMVAAQRDSKWVIVDDKGKEIADGPYDEIVQEGMSFYRVKKNGKCGLLNMDGKVIVPAMYDRINIDQYNSDFIIVSLAGKQTWYSFNGRQIMPLKYDLVKSFRNGLGEVMVDNKWGLVNNKGVEIVPCKYDEVFSGPMIRVGENKLYGLINRDGKVIMPTVCSSITLGWRVRRPIYILTRNGKTGMIDAASGKLFLPFIYDSATSLTYYLKPQGKLLVKNNGLVGVADSTGKIIVPVLYTHVAMLNDTSKNRYWIFRDNKRGMAGEDGKVILPPIYDNVMPLSYGLPGRYLITQDKKQGIADDHGKILIPCAYNYLSASDRSIVTDKEQLFGVMDWKQRTIVPFIYESVEQSKTGYIVRLKGKVGVLDLKGNPIIPIAYNYISGYMITNTYFLTRDNKMGVADNTGKIILPVVYDHLEPCGTENIVITKDKLYGMIDYTGKVIYACKYTLINCVDGKVVEIY